MKTNPIIYKSITCQIAFFITENENNVIVRMRQLTNIPSEKEFKTVKEAKQFIKNLKEIL